jgi:hypothetical protein
MTYDITMISVWHHSVISQSYYDITLWPWYHMLCHVWCWVYITLCITLSNMMSRVTSHWWSQCVRVWHYKCVIYKMVWHHMWNHMWHHIHLILLGPARAGLLTSIAGCSSVTWVKLSTGYWLQWSCFYSQGRSRLAQGRGAHHQRKLGRARPCSLPSARAALRPCCRGGATEAWLNSPLFYVGHYVSIHLQNSKHSVSRIQSIRKHQRACLCVIRKVAFK